MTGKDSTQSYETNLVFHFIYYDSAPRYTIWILNALDFSEPGNGNLYNKYTNLNSQSTCYNIKADRDNRIGSGLYGRDYHSSRPLIYSFALNWIHSIFGCSCRM